MTQSSTDDLYLFLKKLQYEHVCEKLATHEIETIQNLVDAVKRKDPCEKLGLQPWMYYFIKKQFVNDSRVLESDLTDDDRVRMSRQKYPVPLDPKMISALNNPCFITKK